MSEQANLDDAAYPSGGTIPCDRSLPEGLGTFGRVADAIVRELRPRRVLDVGCANGFLVACLWDRGVEAYGIDVSEAAINAVRPDVKPFCRLASATAAVEGRYDLVTCIETLDHLTEPEARQALGNITGCTDTILFSSTPPGSDPLTQRNVRPLRSWVLLLGEAGFLPDLLFDASLVAPHAMLFRRSGSFRTDDIVQLYVRGILRTIEIARLAGQAARAGSEADRARAELDGRAARMAGLEDELTAVGTELQHVRTDFEALRGKLDRAEIELGETRDVVATLRSRLRRLEGEYLSVLSSLSWRATRPLRSAVAVVRRLTGAAR